MRIVDGGTVLSPSDLVGFAACRHLTGLERAAAAKLVARPTFADPAFELLLQRGREHEERYLAELESSVGASTSSVAPAVGGGPDARRLTRIVLESGASMDDVRDAARETEAAMRRGDAVIYQATFLQDGDRSGDVGASATAPSLAPAPAPAPITVPHNLHWRGHADFLLRVDTPSDLGAWSYEPADAKLARAAKADAVLQLCAYAEMVARIQGRPPEYIRLILGGPGHPEERLRLSDYTAYLRWVKRELLATMATEAPQYPPAATYPEPVEKCETCNWSSACDRRRRTDDHLSLVAGITRQQRGDLDTVGVTTVAALAALPVPVPRPIPRAHADALARTREQARLQVESRDAGRILYDLLPDPQPDLGLGALPPPSPGDLFFDIEGDPFAFDAGLEYLFGIVAPGPTRATPAASTSAAATPPAHAFWAHDPATEKKAFEDTIDLITRARAADPDLHVFHYNHYEPTALRRLMSRYGTREAEVDDLLRAGVFVDLYRVVRQGLRAGVESYSIKALEPLYAFTREAELRDAGAARAALETWLELGARDPLPDDIREKVRVYNLDDCLSTWRLRDWLEARRDELATREGRPVPRPTPREPRALDKRKERNAAIAAMADRLRATGEPATALLGDLLDYHWREEKMAWGDFFRRCEQSDDVMLEDDACLAGLELIGTHPPPPKARSTLYEYSFAPQDHKLRPGNSLVDPRGERQVVGTVDSIDELNHRIVIKRGNGKGQPPPVTAVVFREDFFGAESLTNSLMRVGESVATHGIDGDGPYRAARDLLRRAPPRLAAPAAGPPGALVQPGETASAAALRLVGALDDGVLPIQGPPGTGKTDTGAQMALALIESGHRVGVTATSHKVIGNLVERICELAATAGRTLGVIQGAPDDQAVTHPWVRAMENKAVPAAMASSPVDVVAGTSWLWADPAMQNSVDVLFIDEASQFALANAVACAPAARSLVLLGDPQQLEQPIKGAHPPGAEASVLGHVLDQHKIIPAEHGLFLSRTHRLHPDLCAFTSELFYEGQLWPRDDLRYQTIRTRERASILNGTGLRVVTVDHAAQGNQNESPEEVAEVSRLVAALLDGGHWTKADRTEAPLTLDDILVIAPYNAQVAALTAALPPNARVGTVDKFQGQQAPVVIYSMATSTPADAPRGLPFLYSPNRLNVATSRARCLAIVVASPELFRVACRTPQEIKLANAFCRLREVG